MGKISDFFDDVGDALVPKEIAPYLGMIAPMIPGIGIMGTMALSQLGSMKMNAGKLDPYSAVAAAMALSTPEQRALRAAGRIDPSKGTVGQKLSAETAEAKRIDRSQGDSTMMVVAQQMQDMIDNCLMFHSQYLNSEAGSCFVNRDFLSQRLEPQEIQALLTLYTSGSITQKTLLDQLTEGEVLGDEFDVEEEIEATQTGGMVEMAQPKQEAEPDEPEQDEE